MNAGGRTEQLAGRDAGAAPGTVPWGALGLDVLLVLLFAFIGRLSHAEGATPGGVLLTAAPFLAGTAAAWAWLVARRHGAPRPASVRGGVVVWLATLVVGMIVRALSGGGVQPSFVVVAGVVLALFLVGWRALGGYLARRPISRPRR